MKFLLNLFFIMTLAMLCFVTPVTARTITVTTEADVVAIDGFCSLREAVAIADGYTTLPDDACGGNGDPGADVISLPLGNYQLYSDPASSGGADYGYGDLDIHSEVTIEAAEGTTLEAAQGPEHNFGRAIEVASGARVIIRNLTIFGGVEDLTTGGSGGGIMNHGWLALDHCGVRDNSSVRRGGGIFTAGSSELYLFDTTVSGNHDTGTLTGYVGGGGIYAADGARVGITLSTISGNTAVGNGGGILINTDAASGGSVAISNTTISGNDSDMSGGGIYHAGDGPVALGNVTIANNTANADQSDDNDGFGGGFASAGGGTVTLRTSIIAGNTNLLGSFGFLSRDCSGTFVSQGYNLIQNLDFGCTLDDSAIPGTDLDGVDPLLGALADNGGPTYTHELGIGSPAIEGGDPAGCYSAEGAILLQDQRGYERPSSLICDIGAVEHQADAARYVVDTTTDDDSGCTYRDALRSVINGAAWPGCTDLGTFGVNRIEFAPSVSGTITLTSELPLMNKSVTIVGPGSGSLTIDGGGNFRSGLAVANDYGSHALSISGLTFANGSSGQEGGAFVIPNNHLELTDVVVTGNQALRGGGISVGGGSLTLLNVTLTDNETTGTQTLYDSGGAIYLMNGTAYISNSTITGNRAPGSSGGAIQIRNSSGERVVIEKTTISGNSAMEGGAMEIEGGSLSVVDSLIASNTATAYGGGALCTLYSAGQQTVTIANSTISGNTAEDTGGAVQQNYGLMWLGNVTVTGNRANGPSGGGLAVYSADGAVLRNSIVWGNITPSPGASSPDLACDGSGSVVSEDFNLIGDAGSCSGVAWGTGDLLGEDPLLGPLADNGGTTLTHALLTGSPAIDAVDQASGCTWDDDGNPETAEVALATDQRGATRPTDGDEDTVALCDIGAYEYSAWVDSDGDGIADSVDRCPRNAPAQTGGTEYPTVQLAADAAATGDGVVKVQGGVLTESVVIHIAGPVTIRGNYTCDFAGLEGTEKTVLGGSFTIGTGGPVTIDGLGL